MFSLLHLKTFLLFSVTAFFEILGCYLPYLVLKEQKSSILLFFSAICLSIFAYLLTLHPAASGRIYAGYGGVYIFCAFLWLYFVDQITPTKWDLIGVTVSLIGMVIIVYQPLKN